MKIDRLMGILTLLLQCDKMTAPELARRFEVSRRTILRDIDALAMAGIPVLATRGEGGGIRIAEGYKIHKNVLTREEAQNLAAALKGLDSVSRRSSFDSIAQKLAAGSAVLPAADHIEIDLSGYYRDSLSEKIELLRRAIAERRVIRFDYYYPKGETTRQIEPYRIQFSGSAWYVFGWCRLREDFRRFKLNRLWSLSVTDIPYDIRPVPPDAAAGEDTPEPYTARIRFDKSVRFRLIEAYGPRCCEEAEDALLMSLDYTNRDYIVSWILSFGDKAQIVEPKELRSELARIARNMRALYES